MAVDAPAEAGYPRRMSAQAQALLEQVLRLSADEREHLADELLRSLDDDETSEGWAAAWAPEIRRRAAAARSGEDPGVPAEDVLAATETKLRARLPQ